MQARIDTACGTASAAAASNGAAAPRAAEGAAIGSGAALVMSPHPDDDVISMGGTLAKLAAAGLEARSYQGI